MKDGRFWLGLAGILLYLPTGYFYLASGLVVPGIGYVLLLALWVAGLVAVIGAARRRPPLSLLGLPLAALVWFAYLSIGSALFGWTA